MRLTETIGTLLRERYRDHKIHLSCAHYETDLVIEVGRAQVRISDKQLRMGAIEPGRLLSQLCRDIDEQLKPHPYHLKFRPGRARTRLRVPARRQETPCPQ